MIRFRWLNSIRRSTNPSGSGRRENSALRRTARPHVETLEDRTLLSINVHSNFKGLDTNDAGGIVEPPDPIAAAGPTAVIEIVNSNIAFYDKTTGNSLSSEGLDSFFSRVDQVDVLFSDVYVTYDEQAGRFFVSTMDIDFFNLVSYFDFAVSNDSNPMDGFTEMHQIDTTEVSPRTGETLFTDFPRVGWNADAYVVSFNMFGFNTEYQYNTQLLTIDKSSVLDKDTSTLTTYQVDRPLPNSTMAPATMHGAAAGGPMWFVEEKGLEQDGSYAYLRVVQMTNVLSDSPTFTDYYVAMDPYTITPFPQDTQAQVSTVLDTRILNVDWRNNEMVAAQNVGINADVDVHAQWYDISTAGATPALVQQGTIAPADGVDTYMPAVALAPDGSIGMTYLESSLQEDMAMYVTGRSATDPQGTMAAGVLAKAGEQFYQGTRVGDFSGVMVDPTTGTSFWAVNEYSIATSDISLPNWGTWIAEFQVNSPTVGKPAANPQSVSVIENTATAVTLTGSDPNSPPRSLTYIVTANPSHGTLSGTAPDLTYTPSSGYVGTDSFQFKVNNGLLDSDAATADIMVIAPPAPQIVDNGTPGYSETGAWTTETVPSYGGNERYATSSGTGQNTATWQVTGLPSAFYQAQVSWHPYPNQARNAPYAIYDGSTLLQTVTVNQTLPANGPLFGGVPFQSLGTFHITSGTLKVVLSNTGGGTYIVADAMREAFVPVSSTDLNWSATGDGITGPASANAQTNFTIDRTYTVSGAAAPASFTITYYASTSANPNQDLSKATLLGAETLSASADLAVGNHSGASPSLQLPNGGTYYLLAQLAPDSTWVESDAANDTNDVAVAPQSVQVLGPVIVDNGTAGYSETGAWNTEFVPAYGGSERYAAASGTGQNTATWQATGLPAGLYQVQATWHAYPNQSSNAPYAIYDGATLLQTVALNQTLMPSGASFGGVPFQNLAMVNITTGTLKVTLSNTGNGTYVVADAVRFAPLPLSSTDLNWSAGGDGISGPASVNQQTGFTISRTYTVSGAAAPSSFTIAYYASMSADPKQDLSKATFLGKETISAAADLAVGNHSGTSPTFQFANGGGYTLFAVLNPDNSFIESDVANDTNNLAVSTQPTLVSGPVIVDNGDPTYAETGTWTSQLDKGAYGGSDRYTAASGTGSTTATWVVTGLAAGSYAIEASWGPYYNQSTNAPYAIYDGATLVQNVTADQTQTPSGASAGGVPFQILTHVTITSGTLKVVLNNSGNNTYVIADALRVE
jgi:hypothetical protein